jgi:GNAT superfamily N-acetyltransferase
LLTVRRYTAADRDSVRELFVRVNRELAPPHLKDAFESYIERSLVEEIERIPAYYAERRGSFWVAVPHPTLRGEREEGRAEDILGMFGLERRDAATVELRRMYVDSRTRRRGIGREMLGRAEDVARQDACVRMVLSTSELQQAAISLYRNSGYQIVREEIAMEQSNKTLGGGIRRFYFEKIL